MLSILYSPEKDWIEHEIEAMVSPDKDWIEHEIEATVNGLNCMLVLSLFVTVRNKRAKATNLDLENAKSIHPSHKS